MPDEFPPDVIAVLEPMHGVLSLLLAAALLTVFYSVAPVFEGLRLRLVSLVYLEVALLALLWSWFGHEVTSAVVVVIAVVALGLRLFFEKRKEEGRRMLVALGAVKIGPTLLWMQLCWIVPLIVTQFAFDISTQELDQAWPFLAADRYAVAIGIAWCCGLLLKGRLAGRAVWFGWLAAIGSFVVMFLLAVPLGWAIAQIVAPLAGGEFSATLVVQTLLGSSEALGRIGGWQPMIVPGLLLVPLIAHLARGSWSEPPE